MNRKNIGQEFLIVGLQMFHLLFLVRGLKFPQEIQAVSRLRLVAMNHQSHNESNNNKYDKIFGGQKFLRQFSAKA